MKLIEAVALRTLDLLKQQQKTQYRLIKETCLDKKTIQAILKVKTKDINLSTVQLIAEAFGMSLSEFFDCEYFKNIDVD